MMWRVLKLSCLFLLILQCDPFTNRVAQAGWVNTLEDQVGDVSKALNEFVNNNLGAQVIQVSKHEMMLLEFSLFGLSEYI